MAEVETSEDSPDPLFHAGGGPRCRVRSTEADGIEAGYICTRKRGHAGDHIAHSSQGFFIHGWSNGVNKEGQHEK